MKKHWIVDPHPDPDGFWTIRIDDGSESGDLTEQPIATVDDLETAEQIVGQHNWEVDEMDEKTR